MKTLSTIIYISFPVLFISVISLSIWTIKYGSESRFDPHPMIDTKTSAGYSSEKFESLKLGMDSMEVKTIIGEPLLKLEACFNAQNKTEFHYTCDGKLYNQKLPDGMLNDYAWKQAIVVFNSEGLVEQLNTGWIYD